MSSVLDRHDVLLADLDGTLYRGRRAVPGAVEAVVAAAAMGARTVYVTNNASRRPSEVAAHLAELGFPAVEPDVLTSSQAAAAMLAQQLEPGSPVLVVGTAALAEEIIGVGLSVTDRAGDAAAVVQGHSPDTGWRVLAEATVALRAGAVWVACNIDPTLPTERGPLPGNGSMVEVVRTASGREPQVAGKPAPRLLEQAVERSRARRPLVVGDRLDTDIEGGRAAGLATLLVLTGVTDAAEVLAAPPALRPDHLAADLSALTRPIDELTPGPRPGWQVERTGGTLVLSGAGTADAALDALRALCAAHWADGGGPVRVHAVGAAAARALAELGLPNGRGADGRATAESATVAGSEAARGARR
ncbi:HAD-IIA family hydrolase [Pseudonocardia asaccharolytica]|uniref:Acid sugar phosphatase n=1 Tax=Pseudonocardia asaccharolytica DSM 44247 = NBRC 16224 TaxID=1123024 RepID=A0A511D5V1_9PSEU|nr:HAD-IIA family hydrolase [Pseudonocardia asaccharolytica]GEL20171.1 acid sugar phosphatase [Pseudonocardia asaccharolytica DSM 44247 = NBRC 16224]